MIHDLKSSILLHIEQIFLSDTNEFSFDLIRKTNRKDFELEPMKSRLRKHVCGSPIKLFK